jgi:hypothetical protein
VLREARIRAWNAAVLATNWAVLPMRTVSCPVPEASTAKMPGANGATLGPHSRCRLEAVGADCKVRDVCAWSTEFPGDLKVDLARRDIKQRGLC